MTKIIITGSKGRMGRTLISCASGYPECQVVGQIDQGDDLRSVIEQGDVVVDFSSHSATLDIVALCAEHKKALVIGTTGHSDEGKSQIAEFKSRVPIVLSSNFSTGVNTLFWLTRKAAEILGPGFDLEIIEIHHRLKRDAPSGTAKTLADVLKTVQKIQSEIPIQSIREGDVVGEHTVIFKGAGECLELTHRAANRGIFALGALRAAKWIVDKPPGLYSMQDVLGL